MTRFGVDPKPMCNTSQNGHPVGNPGPIRQDCCGTIDVRSSGDIITSAEDERRSLARWNNIRRSKALERRYG
jgi:hypothetical protein